MQAFLIEKLECPACHGELVWKVVEQIEDRVETAEVRCSICSTIFPVYSGIGLFLTSELDRDDLWEQADSGSMRYLREHPEIECHLMEVPLDELALADQFFRVLVL
jgi:uncharacterized protein YbaR (Trm112 family)